MLNKTTYQPVFNLAGEFAVNRLGYGAMRITGEGIWGPPKDHDESIRVLKRAVELGIIFQLFVFFIPFYHLFNQPDTTSELLFCFCSSSNLSLHIITPGLYL